MCGRYTLATSLDELIEVFDVPPVTFDHRPRYNIAPTQLAPVVAEDRQGRRMGLMRWGLVPYWAKDPGIGNRQINARSETVGTRPAFRDSFERRRCLVPADGFYEWAVEGRRKRPYWIHPASGQLLSFAGLWDRWRPAEGDPVYSFTILTTDAGPGIRWVHDRMPVIVPPEHRDAWLERDRDPSSLAPLLTPYQGELLTTAVSTHVNSPENDDPLCVEPALEGG